MSIYKRGGCDKNGSNGTCSKCGKKKEACGVYWYKFMWDGELVRESTRQKNGQVARDQEAAHRTRLSNGEVGIRERKAVPTLSSFMEKAFLPYVETKHAEKPGTVEYYTDGKKMLCTSELCTLRLDEVNDQHAQRFAAQKAKLSASRISCGLRTLRRALNLAYQWGALEKPAKITLAKGERQRDRVLTDSEITSYLAACPQPWRDAATIIRGTGMRPGEVFTLRWEHVLLNAERPLLQVTEGKSKAAKRILPMLPAVHSVLSERWTKQGQPAEGWVFPTSAREGHLNGDTTKDQHASALETSKVKRFEPYVLRHTALTRFAESGCDVFTLARIAGHSSITITQRYVHPQKDAVERAFAGFEVHALQTQQGSEVGTKLGTAKKPQSAFVSQVIGAKGGT
jgi:integrase